jgi:uncharacterized protein (TIGR03067 family)
MRPLALVCILTASSASAAPALKAKPQPNPIIGMWVRVSITEAGQTWPVKPTLQWEFTADGQRFATRQGNDRLQSRYTADPGGKPGTFEIKWADGGIHGVFKVEGDSLTMAVADLSVPRPKDFVTRPGDGRAVYEFHRLKPD